MSVRFYCEGCERHVEEGDELNSATKLAQEAQRGDLFCATCREWAPEYWLELEGLARKLAEQFTNTVTNHRKRFFSDKRRKPQLQALTGGRK